MRKKVQNLKDYHRKSEAEIAAVRFFNEWQVMLILFSLVVLNSSIVIQKWYRRHKARIEMRRRCAWKIFQQIEYSAEQDQINVIFHCSLSSSQTLLILKFANFMIYVYQNFNYSCKKLGQVPCSSNWFEL